MARLPSAQRRAQLIDAAIRVMTREGIAKATTRAIVSEADMSLSVFHYCFESKQELLGAVIESINRHTLDAALTAVEVDTDAPIEDVVRAALRTYWRHVLANPAEHMLTYEITQYCLRQPGFEQLAKRQYRQYTKANAQVIRKVVAARGVDVGDRVNVVARFMAALIDGLTLNYLVVGEKRSALVVLDAAADAAVGMLSDA